MTMKERYHYLKSQGRCVQCRTPTEGSSYCDKCRKMHIKSEKNWYDKCKEEHRCVSCGKVLERDDKGVRCKACAEKNKARRKRYCKKEKVKVLGDIKNTLHA